MIHAYTKNCSQPNSLNDHSTHCPTQQAFQPQGNSNSHTVSLYLSLSKQPCIPKHSKGTMNMRVGLLFVLLLGASWASDARQLESVRISKISVSRNDNLCTLCEEFASEAVDYLAENKTQTEIIGLLHVACTSLGSFKRECITLVDYYAPLFFLEVSNVQPDVFCRKVDLCKQVARISSELHEDSCGLCHHAVSEVLIKLKDPDTQLEIIELLLKACNSMENYVKKCKKMVFEYGPLILANAEKFLESTDICVTLHACNSSIETSKELKAAMVSDS